MKNVSQMYILTTFVVLLHTFNRKILNKKVACRVNTELSELCTLKMQLLVLNFFVLFSCILILT